MLRGAGASVIAVCAAIALSSAVAGAQKPDRKSDQKPERGAVLWEQRAQRTVVLAADAAMAGKPVPSDFPIQFQNDFLRAQSTATWVPFTLTMDPAKISGPVLLYVRIVPRGMTAPPATARGGTRRATGREKKADSATPDDGSAYPYHQLESLDLKPAGPGQPIRISRGVPLQPGSYDLYAVVRERPAASSAAEAGAEPALKMSVLKQPLDVPNYWNGQLSTSTVILADRVEKLPAAISSTEQEEHPYAFGQTQIIVSPDHRFRKSQELVALLQVYNPMLSTDGKFNLEATYTFFQQAAGGEKLFNATEPQELTPADAMTASDSSKTSIQRAQAIPLESFPEGSYRLEIKVTDKLSSKVVTQSATFTVAP